MEIIVGRRYLAVIPATIQSEDASLFYGECVISAIIDDQTVAVVWLDSELRDKRGRQNALSFLPVSALQRLLDTLEPSA